MNLLNTHFHKSHLQENQKKAYDILIQVIEENNNLNSTESSIIQTNDNLSKKLDDKNAKPLLEKGKRIKLKKMYTCPKCNKNIVKSYRDKHELTCSKIKSLPPSNTKIKEVLPEWEKTHSNDIFDRGLVVSGGGYGQGKNRRH